MAYRRISRKAPGPPESSLSPPRLVPSRPDGTHPIAPDGQGPFEQLQRRTLRPLRLEGRKRLQTPLKAIARSALSHLGVIPGSPHLIGLLESGEDFGLQIHKRIHSFVLRLRPPLSAHACLLPFTSARSHENSPDCELSLWQFRRSDRIASVADI